MARTLEFYFDYLSPYSDPYPYLANTRGADHLDFVEEALRA